MVTAEPIFLINCLQQLQSCSLRSLKISFVPAGKLSRYVFHNSSLSTFTSNKCVVSFYISSKCFCKAFLNIINPSIFCTSSFLYLFFVNCFYCYILRFIIQRKRSFLSTSNHYNLYNLMHIHHTL